MVRHLPSMTDMSMDEEELKEYESPSPPRYPYGLCISLCEDELEKLGLEDEDIEPGDMIHLQCMAKVTSVSSNSNQDGDHCRIELQITHIAAAEDEDDEGRSKLSKLYKR